MGLSLPRHSPLAEPPLGHGETLGLLTQSLCSDIPSSVAVSMVFMTTHFAQEGCLGLSIGFLTMSAFSTRLAGIFGINRFYVDTSTLGFVCDEGAKLKERPPRQFSTLRLAKPFFLVLAYAVEVFKGNRFASVFSLLNNAFGYDMVGVPAKSALPAGDGREFSTNILWSLALPNKFGCFLLERLSQVAHLLADVFNRVAGEGLAVVCHSKVGSAQVNTDEVCNGYGRAVGNIDTDQQEPLTVFAKHKVGLPFGIAELFALVIAHNHWHRHTPFQRQRALRSTRSACPLA